MRAAIPREIHRHTPFIATSTIGRRPMPRPTRALYAFGVLALLLCHPAAGGAQLERGAPPERPQLSRRADPNDWNAYFDRGVELLRREQGGGAGAAFYWAARLEPSRGEPLYGEWVAFWMRDYTRWTSYLARDPKLMASPEVALADSLRWTARMRNPLLHQGLEILLYDRMPGYWEGDNYTRGVLAYSAADFRVALRYLGRAVNQGTRRGWARQIRAQAFSATAQYDSALAEVALLRAAMEGDDGAALAPYESKALLDYASSLLHLAARNPEAARQAAERALAEDLSFYPAHDVLGQLALSRGEVDRAVAHFSDALLVAPGDAVMHYRHGMALMAAGRAADAAVALRETVRLEPHYAAARLQLGRALDLAGDAKGALAAYGAYLSRAPRADTVVIRAVEARMAVLGGG
jgi:Flp pilus assembly protein TadD